MFLVFFFLLKVGRSCISEKWFSLILELWFNLQRTLKVLSFNFVGNKESEQVVLESKCIGLDSGPSSYRFCDLGKVN